jgi:hypothetical protein
VTDAPPVEVRVKVCVAVEFKATSPKAMLVALRLSVAAPAFSARAKVLETVPALAVKVTVCAVETAETVAENAAVVAPADTVTDAGTRTAELLLDNPTDNPPLAAAVLRVTVQASVPAPVIEEFVQEIALNAGTPVPLRLTDVLAPVEELLVSDSCPVTAPVAEGANCTVSFAVGLEELRVSGRVMPEMANPDPVTVAALRVTGAVPVEVNVRVCVPG